MTASVPEAVLGGLLLFVLPGYAVTKALFPEWRIRGEEALLRAVEVGALSLVGSVALTILVGFALGALPGNLFLVQWSDPLLEGILAGIAGVAGAVAVARGAFSRTPPVGPDLAPEPGTDDPARLVRELQTLTREERRLRHALRTERPEGGERSRLEADLADVQRRVEEIKRRREADYGA